jgi:glycosyltransferase involved in cell wall biosynthesis
MKNETRPLRVCYFGTYRANYVRNRLMIERLRNNDVEVTECHESLWHGLEDREEVASGGWMNPRFWWRVCATYVRLLWHYLRIGPYDVMIVGYPGQPDILLARVLSWLRRKPLVWDVLMSIYLIALERKLEDRSSLSVRLIHNLEALACRMPDLFILDTDAYASWFKQIYGIPDSRIRLVPLGADDHVFMPYKVERTDNRFICVYYGTFIPSHGVEYIIESARLLFEEKSIHFELIGRGPNHDKILALSHSYCLDNVTFVEWMDENELVKRVASADVLLGTFGTTPQAVMTFQNKIYEGLAMAKPIITGDSPAMRQFLQHNEHIFLCKRADPQSLATAILYLKNDPKLRERLSKHGYQLYHDNFDLSQTGLQLTATLQALVKRNSEEKGTTDRQAR